MTFDYKKFKKDVISLFNHIKDGKLKDDFKRAKDKILAVVNAPNPNCVGKSIVNVDEESMNVAEDK